MKKTAQLNLVSQRWSRHSAWLGRRRRRLRRTVSLASLHEAIGPRGGQK